MRVILARHKTAPLQRQRCCVPVDSRGAAVAASKLVLLLLNFESWKRHTKISANKPGLGVHFLLCHLRPALATLGVSTGSARSESFLEIPSRADHISYSILLHTYFITVKNVFAHVSAGWSIGEGPRALPLTGECSAFSAQNSTRGDDEKVLS